MIEALSHVMKQWIARAISLCVVGPLAASIAAGVNARDGSHATTFLTGHSLGAGASSLAMVLGLVVVMGVAVGRLVDRREGLLNIAFVFGWVAWTMGRMGDVYRLAPESGTLVMVAIEGLIVCVCVLVALVLMTDRNKEANAGHDDELSRFDLAFIKHSVGCKAGWVSMAGAFLAAVILSTILGQSDLPGQSVGVGFFAGIGAGVLGAMAASSMNKENHAGEPIAFAPLVIGVMLCSVLMPVLGMLRPGTGAGANGLLGLIVIGDLPGYLVVSPVAWAMGSLLGVPVGHSWVSHSVQQATDGQGVGA